MIFEETLHDPNITLEILETEARKLINNIFDDFKFGGEYTDDFHEREYIKSSSSFGFFDHVNDIPDRLRCAPTKIDVSEDICSFIALHPDLPNNIFDLLGEYKYTSPVNEGQIILYKKCIESYAKYFHDKNIYTGEFSSLPECTNWLYKIVLWHEVGHWITHWMLDKSGSRWDDTFWSLEPNPNNLLEGLAQVFTYYAIIKDEDSKKLKFMFESLLLGQSEPYHKHIDIIKHANFSWENCMVALKKIRKESQPDLIKYLGFFKINLPSTETNS